MSEHNDRIDMTMRKPKRGWIAFICIVFLAAAGFGVYRYIEYREQVRNMEAAVNVDVFYQGIRVEGVDVGGMAPEEASQAVRDAIAQRLDVAGITLIHEGREWVFTQNDLIDSHNLDEVLEDAWQYGRSGSLKERYQQVVALQENGVEYSADIVFSADNIADRVRLIAQEVSTPAVDAQIHFDPKKESMFTFTDEAPGKEADAEGTLAILRKRVKENDWGQVELIVNAIKPAVTREDLEPLTASIVDFSTSIRDNTAARANNVKKALENIDGYVLMPGEVFSFNEVVGNRTRENGFLEAPIINSDKALVPGMGGGVCQSSTTVYNAAVRAGMEVVERHHHSFPVSYIEKGLDATVSWGTQDLKFKNTRETPVFIHTYEKNGYVHVQIFGMPFPNGGEYKCWSEVTGTVAPPTTVVKADHSGKYVKNPGEQVQYVESRHGYKVTAYIGYYENGELIEKNVLHYDYYKPIQGVVLTYPGL